MKWTDTKRAFLLVGVIHGLMLEALTYEEIGKKLGISLREVKYLVRDLCDHFAVRFDRNDGGNRWVCSSQIRLAVAIHKAGLCPCSLCLAERRSSTVRERAATKHGRQLPIYANLPTPLHRGCEPVNTEKLLESHRL